MQTHRTTETEDSKAVGVQPTHRSSVGHTSQKEEKEAESIQQPVILTEASLPLFRPTRQNHKSCKLDPYHFCLLIGP